MRKLIKRVLYIPKNAKVEADSLWHVLAPSFLGIVLCAACIIGLTMAWFTSGVEKKTGKIATDNFVLSSPVVSKTSGTSFFAADVGLKPVGGEYHLDANSEYQVTLTGDNSAGHGSGYALVELVKGAETANYITKQITYDSVDYHSYTKVIFTVKTGGEGCTMKITYGWGDPGDTYKTYSKIDQSNQTINILSREEFLIMTLGDSYPSDDPSIEEPTQPTEPKPTEPAPTEPKPTEPAPTEPERTLNSDGSYTVRRGDTLSEIAVFMGVDAQRLAAYNGIRNPDTITVGTVLRMPPADYTIPTTPPETTPSPTEDTQAPDPEPTETVPETTAPEATDPSEETQTPPSEEP